MKGAFVSPTNRQCFDARSGSGCRAILGVASESTCFSAGARRKSKRYRHRVTQPVSTHSCPSTSLAATSALRRLVSVVKADAVASRQPTSQTHRSRSRSAKAEVDSPCVGFGSEPRNGFLASGIRRRDWEQGQRAQIYQLVDWACGGPSASMPAAKMAVCH